MPYGISKYLFADNGPQFFCKFFLFKFGSIQKPNCWRLRHINPRQIGKRYNKTVAIRLRHYVNEHQ